MQLRTDKATDKAKPMMMLSGPLLRLDNTARRKRQRVRRGQTQKFIDRANDRPATQDAKPPPARRRRRLRKAASRFSDPIGRRQQITDGWLVDAMISADHTLSLFTIIHKRLSFLNNYNHLNYQLTSYVPCV